MELQESGVYIPPNKSKIRIGPLDTVNVTATWYGQNSFLMTTNNPLRPHQALCHYCGQIDTDVAVISDSDETRPVNKSIRYLIRAMD